MWPRFGVKIGNSTLCAASSDEEKKIEVIVNKHGDRVLQAHLLYEGDEIEIGLTAKKQIASKSSATVINNFQLFRDDLTIEEIEDVTKLMPCRFDIEQFKYELQDVGEDSMKCISPYEVCVEFYKGSLELVSKSYLADDSPLVVLSIPLYYPPSSWKSLAQAAEEAGFFVAQVISEPTAAILAYELSEAEGMPDTRRVLCIKSGGLFTSFTLFEVGNGLYNIIDSAGPFQFGGKQFTDALVDFIVKKFYQKHNLDLQEDPCSMAKIRLASEDCKHALTTLLSTQLHVDSLMNGVHFSVEISQSRFESIIFVVLNEFTSIMTAALEKMGIKSQEVDEIVLVGATMKIPRLQSTIIDYFPAAKLHNELPPDEVVAIGCARQALHVNPQEQQLALDMKGSRTTSHIYIWHADNSAKKKIFLEKGSLLPTHVVVEVEQSTTPRSPGRGDHEVAPIFHIKCEDQVSAIKLSGAKAIQGVYWIFVKIDESDGRPLVKLSCLLKKK